MTRTATILAIATMALAPAALAAPTTRATVPVGGVATVVEVELGEGTGEMRHRPAAGGPWERTPLTTLTSVVVLLGDARLAPLHPAIERWAGQDLVPLRDAMVARTRLAWERGKAGAKAGAPVQGVVRPRLRALLQYEAALREAGRGAEAIALVRAERAAIALMGSWDFSEYAALSSVLAGALAEAGDMEAAAATLAEAEARLAGTPFAINAAANRARYLAEAGRGKEALAVLGAVERANATAKGVDRVPGANLLLDAVRACALTHEGQAAAAAPLVAAIAAAAEPRSGRYAPPGTTEIGEWTAICIGDPAGLAAHWRRDLAAPAIGSVTFATAQPGYRPAPRHRATLAQAHAALGTPPPLRPLPSTYDAALASWHAAD